MPDRFKLTKNSQFYTAKDNVDENSIESILEAAAQNKEENTAFVLDVIKEKRESKHGTPYLLSARVFRSARDVYFLDEGLQDAIYAFIVILEFANYLAVFKKSCANIGDAIDKNYVLIDGVQLANTFDDDAVEFQKIALRNMTISDKAMRARSFEAVDLKGLFSTHAAGRSIPYFLKIRQGAALKTLSAGTGRLVESSERKSADEIADWAYEQIMSLKSPSANKAFLNSFAKLVSLDGVLQTTSPISVLIESGVVFDHWKNDEIELRYKTKKGRLLPLSAPRVQNLIQALEVVYEVNPDLTIKGLDVGARLRKNEKSLTLNSAILKRVKVDEFGKTISLLKYLTKHGLYSVCFADPKYMYFMGRCFEDASGIAEVDSILEILCPFSVLNTVSSEKGTVLATSTSFSLDSIFNAVETIHASDDYVFCDDLGTEWADHIALNAADSSITFVHSKHGDPTVSAGRMHEVVGQAIKNLGYMFFSKAQIAKKAENKFSDTYNLDGQQSLITRTRKGDVKDLDAFIAALQADFRLHRKCVLACSFLSKGEVKIEFDKIKAGQTVPGYVIQLLWIISSFAHAAKDANVIPLIYCRD